MLIDVGIENLQKKLYYEILDGCYVCLVPNVNFLDFDC